ncbi:HDOD domain-containing protein [Neptunomonas antarctica]|uniref:HD-like signal output (HDOD) domain, no enzymatic activity n=1 Tax=Neptunomonas antarctica TaxID=619304 RepID=A0A1N7PMZ3_9GAMM|nr:HDOD domain-containing protein [Neptunomonas antarctica]SIT11900.1 HD-like signal output (HDOD) domain, no enzymatic activity [Neptunomonas antarctica]
MREITTPILKFTIPSRPDTLIKLNELMSNDNPDIDLVILLLKQDAGLYSIVLTTVNAPCFGVKNKITSISHAIILLGLPRLFSLVKLVVLKNTLSQKAPIERFWDTASEVASITHTLTSRYTKLDCDNAYTIGMLHDCGVPMLMQADSNYKNTLRETHGQGTKALLDIEKKLYGIEHFTLGAKLVNKWKMPSDVYKTILLQASFPEILLKYKSRADDAMMYLSLLSMAKDISKGYRHFWRLDGDSTLTPEILACLEYIGLCDYDYLDLKEEFIDTLEDTVN